MMWLGSVITENKREKLRSARRNGGDGEEDKGT